MPALTPVAAAEVLERSFLECRARLLELAAFLDRLDRGGGVADGRLTAIRQALEILREQDVADRAERIQLLFSRPYEADWRNR
jgi:hypothetical protein